jgi:hypothetical protein
LGFAQPSLFPLIDYGLSITAKHPSSLFIPAKASVSAQSCHSLAKPTANRDNSAHIFLP